jgi:ubiquinone/menaquinone biosynthesis C-methylase UbiE
MNKITTKYFQSLFKWINTFEQGSVRQAFPSEFEIVEKAFTAIADQVKEGSNIIDLGCGCGNVLFVAKQILGDSHKYVGIDHNQTYIDVCKATVPGVHAINTDLLSGQANKLIGNADIIFVYIPMDNITKQHKLYENIVKHSKKGAIVLCNDLHKKELKGFKQTGRFEGSDCCNKTDIRIFQKIA